MSEEMTNKQAMEILEAARKTMYLPKSGKYISDMGYALEKGIAALEAEPCEDAVSRGVFEQVMWERDVAIDQLKELGYGFGEKPKTGHWIETAEEYYKAVNEYGGGVNEDTPYFVDDIACSVCLAMFSTIDNETERFDYCPNCGARMVEPQEREVSDASNNRYF